MLKQLKMPDFRNTHIINRDIYTGFANTQEEFLSRGRNRES